MTTWFRVITLTSDDPEPGQLATIPITFICRVFTPSIHVPGESLEPSNLQSQTALSCKHTRPVITVGWPTPNQASVVINSKATAAPLAPLCPRGKAKKQVVRARRDSKDLSRRRAKAFMSDLVVVSLSRTPVICIISPSLVIYRPSMSYVEKIIILLTRSLGIHRPQ